MLRGHKPSRLMVQIAPSGFWARKKKVHGRRLRYPGAGHGSADKAVPSFRDANMRPAELAAGFPHRKTNIILQAKTMREDGFDNWPTNVPMLVYRLDSTKLPQIGHCGPGIICRLTIQAVLELDDLLIDAGEPTWTTGPPAKGAGFFHGTAGKGFALLKLFKSTRDRQWPDRARAFAMHAVEPRGELWSAPLLALVRRPRCRAISAKFRGEDRHVFDAGQVFSQNSHAMPAGGAMRVAHWLRLRFRICATHSRQTRTPQRPRQCLQYSTGRPVDSSGWLSPD